MANQSSEGVTGTTEEGAPTKESDTQNPQASDNASPKSSVIQPGGNAFTFTPFQYDDSSSSAQAKDAGARIGNNAFTFTLFQYDDAQAAPAQAIDSHTTQNTDITHAPDNGAKALPEEALHSAADPSYHAVAGSSSTAETLGLAAADPTSDPTVGAEKTATSPTADINLAGLIASHSPGYTNPGTIAGLKYAESDSAQLHIDSNPTGKESIAHTDTEGLNLGGADHGANMDAPSSGMHDSASFWTAIQNPLIIHNYGNGGQMDALHLHSLVALFHPEPTPSHGTPPVVTGPVSGGEGHGTESTGDASASGGFGTESTDDGSANGGLGTESTGDGSADGGFSIQIIDEGSPNLGPDIESMHDESAASTNTSTAGLIGSGVPGDAEQPATLSTPDTASVATAPPTSDAASVASTPETAPVAAAPDATVAPVTSGLPPIDHTNTNPVI